MAVEIKLACLGYSELDRFGGIKAQASLDAADERQYNASWFAGLGVTGMPYGPSGDDGAEGVLLDRVGPYSGVIVAARDRRGAKIYGQLEPGDTVLHATGPDAKPQVLLKRKKRIAAVLTEDSQGKTLGLIFDGTEDTVTLTAFGQVIQITRDGGMHLCSRNGQHGLSIRDDGVHVRGNVILGGTTPAPGMYLMMGPATGQSGTPVPMVPALGVAVGV